MLDVRLSPNSGTKADIVGGPRRATTGLMHRTMVMESYLGPGFVATCHALVAINMPILGPENRVVRLPLRKACLATDHARLERKA